MSDCSASSLFCQTVPPAAPLQRGKPKSRRSALSLAARYAASAARGDDLPGLRQEACRAAAAGTGADFATLLAYQPDECQFLAQAGVGWRPGVVGRARRGGVPVSSDAPPDPRAVPDLPAAYGIASSLRVLVLGDDAVPFGVLEVASVQSGAFGLDDACFLRLLAHSLAAAGGRLRHRARQDEQAARSRDERRTALREMQHRVRNDLQGICSSLDREVRALEDPRQRAGHERVRRRVMALAGLYEHLLDIQEPRQGAVQAGGVDMAVYLAAMCAKIAAAGDLGARGIALRTDMQPVGMSVERAGRLAIAVNELIANAIEHAFPDGRAGTITVRLRAAGTGSGLAVVVSDNGDGFRGSRPGSAGLGFVERLVRGAGGVLTREDAATANATPASSGGTEWLIWLSS